MGPSPPLLRGHKGPVRSISFSPCNPLFLASGSEDSTVMLWSLPEEGLGTGGLGKEVWFTFGAENATVIDVLYFRAYFFFSFFNIY